MCINWHLHEKLAVVKTPYVQVHSESQYQKELLFNSFYWSRDGDVGWTGIIKNTIYIQQESIHAVSYPTAHSILACHDYFAWLK